MVPEAVSNSIATLGVFLLLSAFALNLSGRLSNSATPYHLLNLAGAGLAAGASYLIGFFPFVVLEATWAVVAGAALLRNIASSEAS